MGFRIPVPASVNGLEPQVIFVYPAELWGRYGGGPVVLVSDNTVRDAATGELRADLAARGEPPISVGGGYTSLDYARAADGSPLPAVWDGNADPGVDPETGLPPGEVPAESVFVAGKMAPEPVYDDPANGGWGTPIRENGPPSSISRRDDRWFNADGTITDAQRVVVGHWSGDRSRAVTEYFNTGASQLIVWDGAQVIAPPVGSVTTGTNVPPEQSEPLPVNDSGFQVAPATSPVAAAPGGGGGGGGSVGGSRPSVLSSPAPSPSVTAPGGQPVAAAGGAAGFLTSKTFGVPLWVWLVAAGVLIYTAKKGGGRVR